jgi:hypothetical protein
MKYLKMAMVFGNCGGELLPPHGNIALPSDEYTFVSYDEKLMPENFPAGQFFRKGDTCFGVCILCS